MITICKIISQVEQASGYSDKQAILTAYSKTPGLKEILKFIYNPFVKTGISNSKFKTLLKVSQSITVPSECTYTDIIRYFNLHQTGSDTDIYTAANFYSYVSEDEKWLAEAIITKNLHIGVNLATLNKVFGQNFIPKISCMLGRRIDDFNTSKIPWPCIVTEKLDGIRRILIKENGTCRFYSRSGHEDTGLNELTLEASHLPDNRVYDGELIAKGTFKDSIALRQATSSIANSKGNKTGLMFNVFDILSTEDFWSKSDTEGAIHRKIILGSIFNDPSVQLLTDDWVKYQVMFGVSHTFEHFAAVPILGLVNSIEEVTPIVDSIWQSGGEGVMLNTSTGVYQQKRSNGLIKVKKTEEHTLTIVDFQEGSGKYEGLLGAVIVDYNGTKLGVGSGFTDAQRFHIWNHKDKYLGTKVEIDCFGESTNMSGTKSLNCPIFKRFVGEE